MLEVNFYFKYLRNKKEGVKKLSSCHSEPVEESILLVIRYFDKLNMTFL